MRLLTTSFSVQTQARRQQLEQDIENSLYKFNMQLETLTTSTVASLQNVHAEADIALKGVLDKYANTNKDISATLNATIEEGSKKVSSSFVGLAERIDNVKIESDVVSKPVELALGSLVDSIRTHGEVYDTFTTNIATTTAKVSTELNATSSLVTTNMAAFQSMLVKSFGDQSVALEGALGKHTEYYKEAIEGVASSIISSMGDVKDLKVDAEERIGREALEFADKLNSLSTAMNKNVSMFEVMSKQNAQAIELTSKSSASYSAAFESIASVSNDLREFLQVSATLVRQTTVSTAALAELNLNVQASIESNDKLQREVAESVRSTLKHTDRLPHDIGKVYAELANQLRDLRGVTS